jgi:mRNA export factor
MLGGQSPSPFGNQSRQAPSPFGQQPSPSPSPFGQPPQQHQPQQQPQQQAQQGPSDNPNNDAKLQPDVPDSVSSLAFSPRTDAWALLSSCWDGKARVHTINPDGSSAQNFQLDHPQPLLCADWHSSGSSIFAGCADKSVMMWDLNTQQSSQVAQHQAPVKCLAWLPQLQNGCLVTAGWDEQLHFWDTRQQSPVHTIPLEERAYALTTVHPLLAVGTADRSIKLFDLRSPQQPQSTFASPLRHQTRCMAAFPDATGILIGSIEGRVAVHHADASRKSQNFTFKCHREREGNEVHQLNDIKFHPTEGTFATCGSDGTVTFWDKNNKQKLRQMYKCQTSISATSYSQDGKLFAYAASYDWHEGSEGAAKASNQKPTIFLHQLTPEETQQKPGKQQQQRR